ncbi:MAG TPA: phosphoribosyl-AMP cyclohydrolase, partial [Methylophaga sp.]|nr:phosphoribosyl-AMP cyclohydrolase [Methylophaga sp.]
MSSWLDQVNWGSDGLAPVITQEFSTKQVLTLA